MQFKDPLSLALLQTPDSRAAAKEKVLVDFEQLFFPEVLLVEDVRSENLRRHATGEILDALAPKPTLNGSIVAMCLGITLLKERKPSFLWMLARSKVESGAVGLVNPSISLLRVRSLKLVKENTVMIRFIIVGFGKIEL